MSTDFLQLVSSRPITKHVFVEHGSVLEVSAL